MKNFNITEINLGREGTSRPTPALRFAHLSDLHLRGWMREHDRLVEALNSRQMDFVFITGDFLSQRRSESLGVLRRLLGALQPGRGIFGVRGNWEVLHGPPTRTLREIFKQAGAELLVNDSRTFDAFGRQICVAGLDDLCLGAPDFRRACRCTEQADYTVLLAHAPLAARLLAPDSGVDLVLSGHTHAGQIRLPLLWRLFLPHWHGGLVEGAYRLPHTRIYVNRGFGSVGLLPFRFRCPPEVAIFTLPLG